MAASAPDRFWRDWYSRDGLKVNGGGITFLGGGAIKSGQTNYNVGTGWWMGTDNGVPKFSLGSPSGNNLTWDGSTLSVTGTIALASVPWSTVTDDDGNKPANNADVTLAAVNGGLSVTGGGLTLASGGASLKSGQTAYNTGTGFWMGDVSGTPKFSIGSAAGNYITWDGTNLSIKGSLTLVNTIPAASVSGLAATATSSDYGSVTGTKPPANADATLTAVNGGLSVTGGGIVLASGGAAIRGGQTAYNTGNGFWLGDVGGITKFSIGSNAGNRLTYDGGTLSIVGAITLTNTIAYSSVTGGPPTGADVTLSAVNGGLSITGGGITLSGGGSIKGGKTTYASTTAGFFLGYDSTTYKFHIGDSTNSLKWTGTALELVGNITGASSIDITGTAKFGGNNTLGGFTASLFSNSSLAALTGIVGYDGGDCGIRGVGGTSHGVVGTASASTKAAVYGSTTHASGFGVAAYNLNSGIAIYAYSPGGTALSAVGAVSATSFSGPLTGNVTGNVTGSSGSCTGNAATATSASSATTAGDVTNAGGAKLICGTYNTNMQNDGNLVVYHGATPYWDATTDLSDGKFKEAIVPTKHAGLDVVNGLRVVDYKWKQDIPVTIKNKDKLKTGFIAQEVQALVPDAVNDIDGTLLLHKEELVPYLVKAVQELSEQVKAMQIEIDALKSKKE
jgi:hypothetical protein